MKFIDEARIEVHAGKVLFGVKGPMSKKTVSVVPA